MPSRYKTIGLLQDKYQQDFKNLVDHANDPVRVQAYLYLTEQTRRPYRVLAQQGVLYHGGRGVPMDTAIGKKPDGEFLFVMDGDGAIYAAPSELVLHHSCFLAGQPVAAAGEIGVEAGKLKLVHDQSGHYRAPLEYLNQFLAEMVRQGVDTTGISPMAPVGYAKREMKALSQKHSMTWERRYPEGTKNKLY